MEERIARIEEARKKYETQDFEQRQNWMGADEFRNLERRAKNGGYLYSDDAGAALKGLIRCPERSGPFDVVVNIIKVEDLEGCTLRELIERTQP